MKRYTLAFQDQMVKSVFQHGGNRLVQLSMQPGQGLSKHKTNLTLALVVLTGRVRFSTGEETVELTPSDMITVDPLQEHEVQAVEKSTVLLNLMADHSTN